MNIVENICEALDLQIGEEFALSGTGNINFDTSLRFQPDGLQKLENNEWSKAPSFYLAGIVYGNFKVVKLPYEPLFQDKYYWVSVTSSKLIHEEYWNGSTNDFQRKYCGNCFRTQKEAESKKREVYKRLTGEEWTDDAKAGEQRK